MGKKKKKRKKNNPAVKPVQDARKEEKQKEEKAAASPTDSSGWAGRWKKWMKIGACGAALLLFGFYIGGIVYFHDRFLANTTINGVYTGHLTAEEAEQQIRNSVESYEIVLKERNGGKETITAQDMDYRYVSNGEIQKLCSTQPYALWFISYFRPSSLEFDAAVSYDEKLLKEKA